MRYAKEILIKIVESSNNYSEVARKLGLNPTYGNRQTLKKYIETFEISTAHFILVKRGKNNLKSEILVENSISDRRVVKNHLLINKLKEYKCELCGQDENWNGKKMSLILDHINGTNNDNRIENLRFVCPNCNATLETHGGKNIKHKYKSDNEKFINKKTKQNKRKVENRPSYIQLINDIESIGYSATGRKYGVSDNSIRKWKKKYENEFTK